MTGDSKDARVRKGERQRRNRSGAWGETIASALLMAKGYRILERRYVSAAGEIDLIAKRGRRVAFIEVKTRATLEAAQASISDDQRLRIGNAAEAWLSKHPPYQMYDLGFDIIFIVPGRWPQHLKNALL